MAESGREASSPWDSPSNDGNAGDSSSQSTSPSSPPQPIILSGSEGLSINTDMQGMMPTQLAPATGTTLTGDVGTIDSSLWVGESQGPKKDSILKGIGITCLFSFFMMMVPMLMMGWAEDSWDDNWHYETLNVDWDESGLNGTFQISNTPVDDCSFNIRNEGHYYDNPDSFRAYGGCGGHDYIYQNKHITRVEFTEGQGDVTRVTFDNITEGEAMFTVYPRYYEQPNDSIELHLPGASPSEMETQSFDENMTPLVFIVNTTNWAEPCPQADDLMIIENGAAAGNVEYTPTKVAPYTECHLTYTDYHYEFTVYPGIDDKAFTSVTLSLPEQQSSLLGSQTFDESMTPLVFPVYTNEWGNYCVQEIRISVTDQGNDWYYPNYEAWGIPPICSDMVYSEHYEINVGSMDYESGYGELFLSEPLGEGIILKADYGVYSNNFVADFAPCFGGLFSFVLFIVWIVQVVRNFQAGLTNKGTGMLVGIIPGFIMSFISVFIIGLILFGF
jgi:hypothetical protein